MTYSEAAGAHAVSLLRSNTHARTHAHASITFTQRYTQKIFGQQKHLFSSGKHHCDQMHL